MTEQELLLRLERLEARGEIENLMARYQHYYTLRNSQAILDELWAEDVCGITLEDRFYGVYEGRSGAFPDAGMKTYYDSAMGFAPPRTIQASWWSIRSPPRPLRWRLTASPQEGSGCPSERKGTAESCPIPIWVGRTARCPAST